MGIIKIKREREIIMKTADISNIVDMEDLLKAAMAGADNEEIVPRHTKRTSEEETTFVRLEGGKDESEPKKKAKLDSKVAEVADKEKKKDKDEDKPNHPQATELRDEQGALC